MLYNSNAAVTDLVPGANAFTAHVPNSRDRACSAFFTTTVPPVIVQNFDGVTPSHACPRCPGTIE